MHPERPSGALGSEEDPQGRTLLASESASARVSLAPDDLHIWWIDLERIGADAAMLLSPGERARAERFIQPRDRVKWTAARVALRQILASYTGEQPADLRLTYGLHGKPALAGGSPLCFSLSHARDRAAMAVARQREVGIDLEPIDPDLDVASLQNVACGPIEAALIDALRPDERLETFLTYWTLKEAYLKGTGAGLSRDPRTVEMALLAEGQAIVRDVVVGEHDARWSVRLLDAGPGWIAAVAVSGSSSPITEFR